MRLAYIVIPAIAFAAAFIGGQITDSGMGWYRTIRLPEWTPEGRVIGGVWTLIYILTAISAIRVWVRFPRDRRFRWIIGVFVLNTLLNVGWSALFFGLHLMTLAAWEAGLLGTTVLALIILIWPRDRLAAALLLPYFLWVCFATYLNAVIAGMN